jgi:hypothetical protein
MRAFEFLCEAELELLDELTRRGFLKGLGAATALGAAGQANAGFFNSPKLFEPGIYEGKARHLLGGHSDDESGEGWGDLGKTVDLEIMITKEKISLAYHGTMKTTAKLSLPTKDTTMEFENIKSVGDKLTATSIKHSVGQGHSGYELNSETGKLEPKNLRQVKSTVKYVLIVNKDGKFTARRISTNDYPQEKGYKYHTWGYNGKLNPKGKDLK